MNIFLLCNGLGQRFKDDDYLQPKPLVYVNGKHLIFHSLDEIFKLENINLYVLYNEKLEFWEFENLIKNKYSNKNIQFLKLSESKGAADTLYQGLKFFNLNDSFVSIDCDILFSAQNLLSFQGNPQNLIYYFIDEGNKAIYSYIKLNNNKVLDIAEKQKISKFACCGIYGFQNAADYRRIYKTIISDKTKEVYISLVYKLFLENNISISSQEIINYNCLGTPLLLQTYCLNNKSAESKRICFDIDNTLFTLAINKDYRNIRPIQRNIDLLKKLYNQGHNIILYTARNMKSSDGNVGLATRRAMPDILYILEKYEIPYHEIYFKPYFDFLIDDLAINSFNDISKQCGFYFPNQESRPNNKVIINNNEVIKETSNEGEIYWYQNIPPNIGYLFPKVHSIKNNIIYLEKINGVSLDYLNCHKQLTKEHIELVFNTLDIIHSQPVENQEINIYANYIDKIKERIKHPIYQEIDKELKYTIEKKLFYELSLYEEKDLGVKSIIHGDCVFTNIFLYKDNNKSNLKFIDMRGKIKNKLTIYGDKFYDFSKLYQSLCGYDFIFNNINIDKDYTKRNKEIFMALFINKFDLDQFNYLEKITASLLYSMLPFHEDKNKRDKYLDLCLSLL